MIYILKTTESMPHWYEGFCREIFKGLVSSIIVKEVTNVKLLQELDSSDYAFITSYKDLEFVRTQATVLYYHQGSGACPYFDFIDSDNERKQLENVNLHLFSLPTFEKLTKEYYQLKNTKTIGFPLDLQCYEKYKSVPKKKKIVVSGHITPGKQFYMCTYLLKDLVKEYEVWFSVIEREGGVTGKWMDFYRLKEFEKMGFKFVKNHPTQEKFYEFLSDASHVFTCSLADTIALPIVEGALCGAIPIVPGIFEFWPQFMDYVSDGYTPFSKYSIEGMIRWKKINPPIIDTKWFDSKLVVERLLEVLV